MKVLGAVKNIFFGLSRPATRMGEELSVWCMHGG